MNKKAFAVIAAVTLVGTLVSPAFAADKPVYMETLAEGADLKVLATSGDLFGDYIFPGTPDGIGVWKSGTKLNIFMNHEFTGTQSPYARAGGAITGGSTISKLVMDADTRTIVSATDAIKHVTWYDYTTGKYGDTPLPPYYATVINSYGDVMHSKIIQRFCSSSLADAGTFMSGKAKAAVGYPGAIYLTGEENGDESRAFALNTTGELVQLPRLGLGSFETFNAAKTSSTTTLLVGNEDNGANNSEIRVYVGKKNTKGSWYEKAGLTNGSLYFVKLGDIASDSAFRSSVGKGKATQVTFNKVDTSVSGTIQNSFAGVQSTGFTRIEDGMFDPQNPNDYYFVTTESNGLAINLDPSNSDVTKRDGGGLWRLHFNNINNPLAGATVELLLDGTEAPYMNKPDNLTIDKAGHIIIQEDPGNNAQVSRVFAYRISDKKIVTIAKFKDAYFKVDGASKITIDEESSGVLDVTSLLKKSSTDSNSYFLLDAQVHAPIAASRPDLADATNVKSAVEGGQMYMMVISDWTKIFG